MRLIFLKLVFAAIVGALNTGALGEIQTVTLLKNLSSDSSILATKSESAERSPSTTSLGSVSYNQYGFTGSQSVWKETSNTANSALEASLSISSRITTSESKTSVAMLLGPSENQRKLMFVFGVLVICGLVSIV